MVQAIVQMVPFGVGLAVAAAPMVVLALLLATSRPPRVGVAFAAGWVLGIVLAASVVVLVADLVPGGPPRTVTSVVRVLAGAALCWLAVRSWRSRATKGTPRWMAGVGEWTAGRALAVGLGLGALNPKNLVLVVAAAGAVVELTDRPAEQAAAVLVLGLLGGLGVGAPVVVRAVGGPAADRALAAAGAWMTAHATALTAVVLLVIGVLLLVSGVTELV